LALPADYNGVTTLNFSDKICSFTGYRFKKLYESIGDGGIAGLKDIILDELRELTAGDFSVFQCGMALGSDMIFADAVLKLKREYPRLKFIAAIPCLNQEKTWNENQKTHYRHLLDSADEVRLISESEYFDGCMQMRNRHLVDTCDLLLAVFDGKRGGTMQTVEYAKKRGKKISIIDPSTLLRITPMG